MCRVCRGSQVGVQTRYILPFQPTGFALIAGVLAGVMAYYLTTRKNK